MDGGAPVWAEAGNVRAVSVKGWLVAHWATPVGGGAPVWVEAGSIRQKREAQVESRATATAVRLRDDPDFAAERKMAANQIARDAPWTPLQDDALLSLAAAANWIRVRDSSGSPSSVREGMQHAKPGLNGADCSRRLEALGFVRPRTAAASAPCVLPAPAGAPAPNTPSTPPTTTAPKTVKRRRSLPSDAATAAKKAKKAASDAAKKAKKAASDATKTAKKAATFAAKLAAVLHNLAEAGCAPKSFGQSSEGRLADGRIFYTCKWWTSTVPAWIRAGSLTPAESPDKSRDADSS